MCRSSSAVVVLPRPRLAVGNEEVLIAALSQSASVPQRSARPLVSRAMIEPRVKQLLKPEWFETLAVPVLLKWCPASRFLIIDYFCDGVGISPTAFDSSGYLRESTW
ncbi:unnamed protein product [Soboliphyme baturini]|uniref:Uncharacterized protein n=1 Tax=Soboliphyme baturini TaxID=241478 RepID=A0A3P8EQR4_9BILA|nr:unnamed protein product [Soboliphyme baturini]